MGCGFSFQGGCSASQCATNWLVWHFSPWFRVGGRTTWSNQLSFSKYFTPNAWEERASLPVLCWTMWPALTTEIVAGTIGTDCVCRAWLRLLQFFHLLGEDHIRNSSFSLSPRTGDSGSRSDSDQQPRAMPSWLQVSSAALNRATTQIREWILNVCWVVGVAMQNYYGNSWLIHMGNIDWKFMNVVWRFSYRLIVISWSVVSTCEWGTDQFTAAPVTPLGAILWNWSLKKRKPTAYPSLFLFFLLH